MSWRFLAIAESNRKNSIEVTDRLARLLLGLDGGPGSGNFGHAGRPGKVGGSQKESGGASFRTGSKESGYSSFTKHEAFKGIASHARNAKSKGDFVHSLSSEQRDALTAQFFACGADMGEGHRYLGEYADRMYEMLHNRKGSEIRQQNKPVDGKDISMTWKSKFAGQGRGQESTKAIDTDIEDVLHQQGFDGVPKVVSQAELDRILKEHPEMPVLMRSYTGANPEQAKQFDNDLEHGWFYVDCNTGGAGFGQGMYSAGLYDHEPRDYKDGEYYLHPNKSPFVKDDHGRIYKVDSQEWTMSNPVLKYPDEGDRYIFTKENEDGTLKSAMLEAVDLDEFGVCWRDMNTGEIHDGSLWNSNEFDAFQDIEEFTEEGARKEMLKGIKNEMGDYRMLGVRRVENETQPQAPEGKRRANFADNEGENHYYYYDDKDMKPFREEWGGPPTNIPKNGEMVVVGDPNSSIYKNYGGSVWMARGDKLVSMDGRTSIQMSDLDEGSAWSYLEGRCEDPDINPTPVTRMMTLDPSAKIIAFDDLKQIRDKSYYITEEAKEKRTKELEEFLGEVPFNDAFCESKLYNVAIGAGPGNLERDQIKKIDEYRKTHPERMEKIQKLVDKHIADRNAAQEEAKKYEHYRTMDEGVLAAALGYDAINAEGHGRSGSYTVVLNRTKLIISEDKVDIRG